MQVIDIKWKKNEKKRERKKEEDSSDWRRSAAANTPRHAATPFKTPGKPKSAEQRKQALPKAMEPVAKKQSPSASI